MLNAHNELLEALSDHLKECKEVRAGIVGFASDGEYYNDPLFIFNHSFSTPENGTLFDITAILNEGWKTNDWVNFLHKLNFQYDSENGKHQLHGVIWFDDGSWLERVFNGKRERWIYRQQPIMPRSMRKRGK